MSKKIKLEINGWCVFHKSGPLWERVDGNDSERCMKIYKTKIYKKKLNFKLDDNDKIYTFYPDNGEYFYFNEVMNKICKCYVQDDTQLYEDTYPHIVVHGFSYDTNDNISIISSS